jgi:SAM-dependent methyltransferase
VSRAYGYDRGTPVDRCYIHDFVVGHRADIRGRILDVGDDENARRYASSYERIDVLHPVAGTPGATVIGDLETGEGIPHGAFDCVLLLETLNNIYDVRRAVQAVRDSLRPGGVAFFTANGLAARDNQWHDYWRLTSESMRRLLDDAFGAAAVEVRAYGNVRAAAAYLYGLAAEELGGDELAYRDPSYEVTVCGFARR